ncbi:1-deoxy-D-xylulose-5-phosphate synthase 1-like [Ylistrum balloti]|uniref:1-deoxy-D-xylulose-5-phosphate synthase 1-like n=1 Tax=Ylistrum balloti TaxID=509963 RepID=UPI002905B988|nr:1-deoxy-D-xylulose-5-phosphate synthase 1-like [Ylistrum balloti]
MDYPLLSSIIVPEALKKLPQDKWAELIEEVRTCITESVKKNGGHLGPNLGAVEIIFACHMVFNLNQDRLLFDVGHQCYAHKILTCRYREFNRLRQKNGLSGYPYKKESDYDVFRGGHASTAISTALGMRCGFDFDKDQTKKFVVSLVGDGAMTGGMAFEALNHAGHIKNNLIVILNDNSMSISPTIGGLAKALNNFRHNQFYTHLKKGLIDRLKKIPKLGHKLEFMVNLTLEEASRIASPAQLFTVLGFDYMGPINGNDVHEVISTLKAAKKVKVKPVLIHALTQKGIGFRPHGKNGETIIGPHALSPPKAKIKSDKSPMLSYSVTAVDVLKQLCKKNEKVITITAAMAEGTGLNKFEEVFPHRYFDVGICEAHAVGFSAGLAASGLKPIFMVYSTFLQRAFDQIFHELVLQQNIPTIFCIDRAGLVGDDGPSHHGSYDIAYLRIFPNFVLMAPKDGEDLKNMIAFATQLNTMVAIRYPRSSIPDRNYFKKNYKKSQKLILGKSEVLFKTKDKKGICLYAYGSMVIEASKAWKMLAEDGIHVTLVNARFAKPIDVGTLRRLYSQHQSLIVLEEGIKRGGLGSAVLEELNRLGLDTGKVLVKGLPDQLVEHASRQEQLQECGLDSRSIVKSVKLIKKKLANKRKK